MQIRFHAVVLPRTVRYFVLLIVPLLAGCIADAPMQAGPEDAIQAGLTSYQAHTADGPLALEVQTAAGLASWRSGDVELVTTIQVPAPGADPIEALYEIYVLLQTDVDPHAWQDPVRGEVDLIAQLLGNAPAALNSSNDAVQSFQLLAMAEAGLIGQPAVPELRQRLLALQHEDGAWGCGPWVGPECTSYALRALAVSGGIPHDAREAAVAYIEARRAGAGYSDPLNGEDHQITAAAIRALVAAQAPIDVDVIDGLITAQHNGMWYKAGQPSTWVTGEVLLALLAYQAQ